MELRTSQPGQVAVGESEMTGRTSRIDKAVPAAEPGKARGGTINVGRTGAVRGRASSATRRRTRTTSGSKKIVPKKAVPSRNRKARKPRLDPEQQQLAQVIETGSPDDILTALRIGTEEPEELSYDLRNFAYSKLLERFRTPTQRKELWKLTRYCAARPEIVARQMSCAVLDFLWKDNKPEAERILLNLARDEDWEVREYASATLARIVKLSFRANYPYYRKWAGHPDPSIRRQVMISLVAIGDADHPEWAKPLLEAVEVNLKDRDPYIRRNLGPFALGEGMLRYYPEPTLEAMVQWAKSKDAIVRWNVAMGLTTSWAGDHWMESLKILRILASDRRRVVWQAVSVALENLLKQHPEQIEPLLKGWMKEPPLRVAVSTALTAVSR